MKSMFTLITFSKKYHHWELQQMLLCRSVYQTTIHNTRYALAFTSDSKSTMLRVKYRSTSNVNKTKTHWTRYSTCRISRIYPGHTLQPKIYPNAVRYDWQIGNVQNWTNSFSKPKHIRRRNTNHYHTTESRRRSRDMDSDDRTTNIIRVQVNSTNGRFICFWIPAT